jgi:hypothetical protein
MSSSACDSLTQAQQGALRFQIDVAVQKKQLDAAKQQGAAAIELLQAAVQLSKAADKGEAFDASA